MPPETPCPKGYSLINGECVKNPTPNPPLVEENSSEDDEEVQSSDEA